MSDVVCACDNCMFPVEVAFELDEASLNTMLEGLGKIRDQLSNVAT